MGHGGHLREEFEALVDRLEAGPVAFPMPGSPAARAAWQEILEILFTPEHARLGSLMPTRSSEVEVVAKRWGMAPEEALPHLQAMASKGLVLDLVNPQTGETRWLLAPPVSGFLNLAMHHIEERETRERLAKAIYAYIHGDDAFLREFSTETGLYRAMVREDTLGQEDLAEILDWESVQQIVDNATTIAVSNCCCRHTAEHAGRGCDAPMETCFSLDLGAQFTIRRGFGRRVEKAEAMQILADARERGLLHMMDNVRKRPAILCCCCGCCCVPLRAFNEYGISMVKPSGFLAGVERVRCRGCTTCVSACAVNAVSMIPAASQAEKKRNLALVDEERCLGCGVCASACDHGAMQMKRRAVRPHVPADLIEYGIRKAVEHGRLGHLMFDQGASRGSRFLNRAINAICALPPAKQALASEQLRSRFINRLLASRSVRKLSKEFLASDGMDTAEPAEPVTAGNPWVPVWVLVILALLIAGLVVVLGLFVP